MIFLRKFLFFTIIYRVFPEKVHKALNMFKVSSIFMEKLLDRVISYMTTDWKDSSGNIRSVRSDLLKLAGFSDMRTFLSSVSGKTRSLTFFAGAGARWINSIEESDEKIRSRFDPGLPRCMAGVKDLICPGKDRQIPVGIYNLGAVRNMARNVVIYRGSCDMIQARIADYLSILPDYIEQTYPPEVGKPLGHGDAALQAIDHIRDSEFVITNFAADSNSKKTIALSLLALFVLDKYGKDIDLIIPTAYMKKPKYPVLISEDGLPVYFSQSKLRGDKLSEDDGQSNLGIRVYRTEGLIRHLDRFRQIYERYGSYSSINKGNNELALDNVDEAMAKENRALAFCIGIPEEITPIKKVSDIPHFEKAMEKVLQRDRCL
jgi:hypothetical protein